MKANELMLGDWVEFSNQPSKIECIDIEFGFHVEGNDNPIMEHELSPIPLTEEILKVNGLREKVKYEDSIFSGEDAGYYYVDMPDEDRAFFLDVNLPKANAYICVDYVHELQHALRLCGLNELADNFKITL